MQGRSHVKTGSSTWRETATGPGHEAAGSQQKLEGEEVLPTAVRGSLALQHLGFGLQPWAVSMQISVVLSHSVGRTGTSPMTRTFNSIFHSGTSSKHFPSRILPRPQSLPSVPHALPLSPGLCVRVHILTHLEDS